MKKFITPSIAVILGIIALQIPFTRLIGANVKFTLFDFMAPTAGAFLGTIPGILAIFISELINIGLHGTKSIELGTVIRLFPILFGVAYFSNKKIFY